MEISFWCNHQNADQNATPTAKVIYKGLAEDICYFGTSFRKYFSSSQFAVTNNKILISEIYPWNIRCE